MFNISIFDFAMNYSVNNQSNSAVIVKHKGGMSYIVPPSTDSTVINRQEIIVTVHCKDIEQIVFSHSEALTRLDKAILKELENERRRIVRDDFYFSKSKTLSCKLDLSANYVDKETDAIQSELFGFSLYNGIQNRDKVAVGTPLWTLTDVLDETRELSDRKGILRYVCFVNDPGRVSQPYYINMLGSAVKVPVIRDNDIDTGLYIVYLHSDRPRQNIYYAFENINKEVLERNGLFDNKHDCEKGGNTERFTRAEELNKSLKKSLDTAYSDLETAKAAAARFENLNKALTTDIAELKYQNSVELSRINYTHKTEMTHMKHDLRMKENISKANLDFAKQKVAHVYWGDFAKAIGAIAGAGFAGYKLLTS